VKAKPNGDPSPSLETLLDFAQEADLREVVWERGDRRMAFKRAGAIPFRRSSDPPPETPPPASPPRHIVRSPIVGTFQRGPKDRPPLVVEGDRVSPGQRLAIVEAMQVPRDVIADAGGTVLRVLLDNGRPAEYGQPLFEIDPGVEHV
jgi:biotin carboxyl carrier protein